jgi:hypothetical protein
VSTEILGSEPCRGGSKAGTAEEGRIAGERFHNSFQRCDKLLARRVAKRGTSVQAGVPISFIAMFDGLEMSLEAGSPAGSGREAVRQGAGSLLAPGYSPSTNSLMVPCPSGTSRAAPRRRLSRGRVKWSLPTGLRRSRGSELDLAATAPSFRARSCRHGAQLPCSILPPRRSASVLDLAATALSFRARSRPPRRSASVLDLAATALKNLLTSRSRPPMNAQP